MGGGHVVHVKPQVALVESVSSRPSRSCLSGEAVLGALHRVFALKLGGVSAVLAGAVQEAGGRRIDARRGDVAMLISIGSAVGAGPGMKLLL